MKKRSAFSCYLAEENSCAVKLSRGEGTTYVLDWIENFGSAGDAPETPLKELGGPASQVIQLLDNDDVSLMINSLPAMKHDQLKIALEGIIRRQKKAAQEEWVLDFRELPELTTDGPQRESRDVSATFARASLLEDRYAQAEQLGYRPKGFLPGYLALDELYRRHRPEKDAEGAWNLVHLGQTEKFLCVADEHGVLLTRSLPADLSDGVEREEYIDRLAAEIERSNFFAQQAERSMQVQRIVFCGDPELAADLSTKLTESSDFEIQNWRAEEFFAAAEGAGPWQQLIPLSAAALAFERPPYDLLPPGLRKSKYSRIQGYATLAASTFGLAAVPILLVGSLMTTQVQGRFLEAAKDEMAEAESRVESAAVAYLHDRVLQSRQASVDLYGRDLPDLASLLRDIAQRTPATVVYTTLDLREDSAGKYRLVLQGKSVARDGSAAQATFLEFLVALSTCEGIREIAEPTYLEIGGADEAGPPRSRALFTLEYELRQGGD